MKRPSEPPASEAGYRRPDYVIETWVSEQLRNRMQRHGASLAEVFRQADPQAREPDTELEASQ
jgi:hypothetical protein